LASHVSWELADVCLEFGPREVKEFIRRNPRG
jgi:hypothetical protein